MRILELRKEKKVTQKQLADFLNVTECCVSYWEKDKRLPRYESLLKMAEFFDVSVDYLTGLAIERGRSDDTSAYALLQDMTVEELEELLKYKNFLISQRQTK